MHRRTGERWIALAAVVAALGPAVRGALDAALVFVPGGWLLAGAAVGAIAAVVVLVAGWRSGGRATVTFALSTLLWPVAWQLPGVVGSFLSLVSIVLVLVFGVLVVRGSSGFRRALGAIVAVAGAVLVVTHFAVSWFAPLAALPQSALLVVFATVPSVAQAVGYGAAAALFLPPLLAPVRDGVRTLWSTADVR